jgi:hypothetical protein
MDLIGNENSSSHPIIVAIVPAVSPFVGPLPPGVEN